MRINQILATTQIGIAVALSVASPVEARICPKVYLPVCGLTQTKQLQTFSNACVASAAGATVLHAGRCNGALCPDYIIHGGVCAKSAVTGAVRWYDNLCWAEKNWAIFLHYGPPQSCFH